MLLPRPKRLLRLGDVLELLLESVVVEELPVLPLLVLSVSVSELLVPAPVVVLPDVLLPPVPLVLLDVELELEFKSWNGIGCSLSPLEMTANSTRPLCGLTMRSSILPRSSPCCVLTLPPMICLLARMGLPLMLLLNVPNWVERWLDVPNWGDD